jgi:hypothetical protein
MVIELPQWQLTGNRAFRWNGNNWSFLVRQLRRVESAFLDH